VPSSVDEARSAVAHAIVALERACLDADAALVDRRWSDVRAAFDAQVELTGELAQLFATTPAVSPANDAKVAARVNGVYAYREGQLERLSAYRDDVLERLSTINKMKAFARAVGRRIPRMGVVDGQY
jgi:hypothetical protein